MKKYQWFVVVLTAVFMLGGCGKTSLQDEILDVTGIDVGSEEAVRYDDSHGGFHGDGTTFAVFQLPEEEVLEQIQEKNYWKELPFDRTVTALVYGVKEEDEMIGPYLTDGEGKRMLPKIREGYYCFIDRYRESSKSNWAEDILERSSQNFTIAVYDTETGLLYYMKLDT